jgi:hypothetical protein
MRAELARQQWQEGYGRFRAESADPGAAERLQEQVEAVTDELRHRVGGVFTLGELAQAYEDADRWARAVIAERCPRPGWARTVSTVADAAFYLYARGANDYRP